MRGAEDHLAAALAEARADAEARWTAAVEGLAEEYATAGRQREAAGRPAWPLDVAARLRGLTTSSEEQ